MHIVIKCEYTYYVLEIEDNINDQIYNVTLNQCRKGMNNL